MLNNVKVDTKITFRDEFWRDNICRRWQSFFPETKFVTSAEFHIDFASKWLLFYLAAINNLNY